jgi:multidrug efflux pump subunit AcrA (membrane-fusion protein)
MMQRTRLIIVASLLALSLVRCAGQKADSTPEEAAALTATFANVVTASGKVVPARWATLSFEAGGRVEWLVVEGSEVAAGDTLARLDTTDLEHAVAQARAALATAQAQLATAKAGATPEEIAAAEGAVVAAQGGVAAAEAAVTQAEINPEIASASVKQAEDAVDAAEAALAQAQGTLDAAEAALAQAQGTLDAAEAAWAQAQGTLDAAEAALAQAQGTLGGAKADLARAQTELARLQAGARPEEIAAAAAALRQAQAGLEGAKQPYDIIAWRPGAESTSIGIAYRQALAEVEQAQAQVDLLKAGAMEEEIAAAKAGVDAAQAQVTIAEAGVDAAQAQVTIAEAGVDAAQAQVTIAEAGVDAAQAQVTTAEAGVDAAEAALTQAQDAVDAAKGQVALAETGVTAAQAQVEVAEGQLAQAEAQRDRLKAGATKEEIAVLEAQVAQAEAALAQAESALTEATLVAPFAGTVGAVHPREAEVIAPGAPVLALGDVSTLRVETTDLEEIDVARVAVDQEVSVTFDALPERLFNGQVTRVSPMAEPGAGGVHYTAVIELDEIDSAIRWGMTAFVDIEIEE